jgi:hypothetical protein
LFDKLAIGFGFVAIDLEGSTLVLCSFVWQIKKDWLLALGLLILGLLCGELGGISSVLSFSEPRWFHFGFVLCCLVNYKRLDVKSKFYAQQIGRYQLGFIA